MFGLNAGAMVTTMALVLFSSVGFLGGVNPVFATPSVALLVIVSGVWVVGNAQDKKQTWSWTALDIAVGLFLTYVGGRYLASQLEYEARNELILITCCGLAYFISAKSFCSKKHRSLFVFFLMVFALFQSGFGVWQSFTKSDFIFHWERPELYNGRGSGTFVCPNHLAGFLEMSLGLIAARAAIVGRESSSIERSVLVKVFNIYVVVMLATGLLSTLSRAGWFSASVGMAALIMCGRWKWRQAAARVGVVFAVGLCAVAVLWSVEPIRNYLFRSLAFGGGGQQMSLRDPTIGGRTMMWSGTMNIIRENPIIGSGMGSWQWIYQKYKDYRILSSPEYAHNDYLNLAADYGCIGVVLMVFVIACFFHQASKIAGSTTSSEDRAFAIGAMVSVVSILVHSWFDFNLHIFGNALFLAVILGATSAIEATSSVSRPAGLLGRRLVGAALIVICGLLANSFIPTLRAFRLTNFGDIAKADLDYDEALSLYSRAALIDPNYPRPLINIGHIYRDQAKWRVGKVKQRERTELVQKAVESYDKALTLNPYLSDVWVSKGRVLELLGHDEPVLRSFLKAIEIAPVSAYAHFVLGQFYRERGDDQKALEYFEKADTYFLHNDSMFQINRWEQREKF
jgi:O-antigen ligase